MTAKTATIVFTLVVTESDGLSGDWQNHEQRLDLQIPIDTVKAIDFNRVRNELLRNSIESLNKSHEATK